MSAPPALRFPRGAGQVVAAALLARLAVVAWAGGRFPPAADGVYYHTLAARLAAGQGYTWRWPDGVVTFAAHYPVGYPAMLSVLYRLAGPSPLAAGLFNAVVGAIGALALHQIAARAMGPRAALAAGLLTALDPALALYTPALMTEGVTASLVCVAGYLLALAREAEGPRRRAWLVALGASLGVATLVRPQCLLLAPAIGLLAARPAEGGRAARRSAVRSALAVTTLALAACLPWTLRNGARMGRFALVSVNGGWNLLIGAAPNATGHWSPVDVPDSCRAVFDEAGKDACFAAAARALILEHPLRWLLLAPAKLAATFDFCDAAPWYLHESNAGAFGEAWKLAIGSLETLFERLLLVAALGSVALLDGPRPWPRRALAALGAAFATQQHGYVAVLCLLLALALLGRALLRGPALLGAAAAVIATTALVHAIFFGAGRYALVVFPWVAALAGGLLTGLARRRDTLAHAPYRDRGRRPPAGARHRQRPLPL